MTNRFHFTIKQKLQILDELEESKNEDFYKEKNITKIQVQGWKEKKAQMLALPEEKQSSTYKLHQGPQKKYADLYTFLYSQVKEMRAEKMVVTHELLISLAINELDEISMLSYNGKRSLIDRFMKFNNLSLRTITSTSSSNADQITEEDRQTIDSFRREYNNIILSNNIPQECVFNMDQCGVAYEIPPKKTIDHVGSQQSSITTRGITKKRVTVISLINCAGESFQQLVIFKGVDGKRVEESLQQFNDASSHFTTQENAWTDGPKLKQWLELIWWPIASSIEGPKLLVVDSYPLHLDFEEDLRKFNTFLLFVPKGLTWQLQPLDNLFHKAYKKYAQDYFVHNQRTILQTEEEKRRYMVLCVKEIYGKIDGNTIRSSWKKVSLEYPNQNRDRDFNEYLEVQNSMDNNFGGHEIDVIIEEEPGSQIVELDSMMVEQDSMFNHPEPMIIEPSNNNILEEESR